MALMICPDCSKSHSDGALACPDCGRPNQPAVAAPRTAQEEREILNVGDVRVTTAQILKALLGREGKLPKSAKLAWESACAAWAPLAALGMERLD